MGRAYFQKKKYNEAIDYFQKATEINSLYAEAYFRLACTYKIIGNSDKARQAFNLGKQLNQKLSEKYMICNPDI